jgi:hypothetical protein
MARALSAFPGSTARLWDVATGAEIARITLDAAVTAMSVRNRLIALGDALGRVHVFEAEEFLSGKN